jgi:hypothetical protein
MLKAAAARARQKGDIVGLVLIVVVLCLLFGGLPAWGYHSYGYAPTSLFTVVLIVLVVLLLSGRL